MPNGISCAYFAARNHIYGKKEQNLFKEGIAGAQTARTIDTVTKAVPMKGAIGTPVTTFFSKAAALARKIVYPLIIASGVYNTAVSDDKVRTGASQATGIATMYTFEQVAEKSLKGLNDKLAKTKVVQNNKVARVGLYVAKGLAFVGASLAGYNVGSKAAEKIVDDKRAKKNQNTTESTENKSTRDNLFEEMKLL